MDAWFIGLHAAAAVVALVAGVLALVTHRGFGVHLWSLVAMASLLVPALVTGWESRPEPARRIAFVGLILLAAVMVAHARRAVRTPLRNGRLQVAHVDAVGFNLIGLADGFAVVEAIQLGWPAWAVAAAAVAVIAVGHVGIRWGRARVAGGPTIPAAAGGA